jgi:hypothetical protein
VALGDVAVKSTAPLWVLAAALTTFYVMDRRHRAAETEQLHAQIQALAASAAREAPAATPAVVRQPVFVTQVLTAAPPPEPPAQAAVREGPPRTPAPRPAELAARFDGEPRAAGASSRSEGIARRAVASFLGDRSAVEGLECRTTLCRLAFVHPDVPTSNALIEKLFIGPDAAFRGASMVAEKPEPSADGRMRIVLYVPSEEIARVE